ncbi:MAG TPA: urea carboxylase-associated family protein [Micromonospora sp.]|nr:urea carboxylase-associated family protein [Micromonospora sp.]
MQSVDRSGYAVVEEFHVPTGTGRAFTALTGQLVVFSLIEGTQVVDLNVFNRHDLRERFGSSVTRPIHGTHVGVGDALLSCPPWERPMARVVGNTVVDVEPVEGAQPRTASHDLLFGRCSRALRRHLYGSDTPGCQEILAAAIEPFGLTEYDVHDPLNIFMRTGIDDRRELFFVEPCAGPGDSFELLMEVDGLLAMSSCPGRSSGRSPRGAHVTVLAPVSAAPGDGPQPAG